MTNATTEKTAVSLFEISFDNDEPYGVMHETDQVNPEGPVMVVLPGNGFNLHDMGFNHNTNVLKMANKMRKYLEEADVDKDIIRKTRFYVVSYKFPKDFCEQDARTLLHKKHGRTFVPDKINQGKDGFSEEEKNPAYIESLYDKIVRPRVTRLNGKIKTDAATAIRNMAQITVFAHCHGAYTALKMEEPMRQNMQKLGYSKEEILAAQKQMTVIAYAPACPLGVAKMNVVSYKSLNDTTTDENYNNAAIYTSQKIDDDRSHWVDTSVLKKENSEFAPFDFKFSFYPDKLGNVFVIKQKSNYDSIIDSDSNGEVFINKDFLAAREHNNTEAGETEDSENMFTFMINSLANACRRAHKQSKQQTILPPPSVQDLVVGTINPEKDLKIFEGACQAGIEQSQKIEKDIKRLMAEQRQRN